MIAFSEFLKHLGQNSLDFFWFPLLIWTLISGVLLLYLSKRNDLNPLYQYHFRTAVLLALPVALITSSLLNFIPGSFGDTEITGAILVVQNPIQVSAVSAVNSPAPLSFSWSDPAFLIGAGSFFLGLISIGYLFRLAWYYVTLKALYKSLQAEDLHTLKCDQPFPHKDIKVAYHKHSMTPFTFGWKNPIIVLPPDLKEESRQKEMAINHELTHIERGDYLIQLGLSVISSIFWFHPLIHFNQKEIDAYREISCDVEVLNRHNYSIRDYATMLFELMPLKSGEEAVSVSMAVKPSTLKKRIQTMQYHKLYKHSFKQSVMLLILLVVGITLPVACSDMRGPSSLSPEELEKSTLQVSDAALSINGVNLDLQYNSHKSTNGLGTLIIYSGEYGTFKIAPRSFEGAVKAGNIDGNRLTFTYNQMNVVVQSNEEILSPAGEAELWVKYIDLKTEAPVIAFTTNAASLIPPPPPLPLEGVQIKNPAEPDTMGLKAPDAPEDFFVVVEEMPKLIGGVQGLRSKIQYPEMARKAGIEGSVTLQFIVNEDGEVEDPKIIRGIGAGCDEEALRVVKNAEFTPGKQRGRNVRVQFALSVNFSLSEADFAKELEN